MSIRTCAQRLRGPNYGPNVPKTGSPEIELFCGRSILCLRSTRADQLDALIEAHVAMGSSLRHKARGQGGDASALFYAVMRLPALSRCRSGRCGADGSLL
jgi:hypothetical protein